MRGFWLSEVCLLYVFYCYGSYGYYLKYDNENYSIPNWATTGGSPGTTAQSPEYTADGGAGGVEMLDWYERHTGPFWMFLSYDKFNNFPDDGTSSRYAHLSQYNEIVQVYISDFSYTVNKRGQTNHDLWDISVSLEEV